MFNVVKIFLFVALTFMATSSKLSAGDFIMIDAHSQFDRDVEPERIVLLLDRAGVAHVILSTRRGRLWRDVSMLAQKYPSRVTASVRTKGKHFHNNKPNYYKLLNNQLSDPTFTAMAEVILWHAQKGNQAPEQILGVDAPQVQEALNAALSRKWPFVIHIEFRSAKEVGDYDDQMRDLESLLKKFPTHPFALTHVGQLSSKESHRLFDTHKNLYLLTSRTVDLRIENSRQPWTLMVEDDTFLPEWLALIKKYPTRFILAFDNVWDWNWDESYIEAVSSWRKALSKIPPDAAEAIAYKNAKRLWNLK